MVTTDSRDWIHAGQSGVSPNSIILRWVMLNRGLCFGSTTGPVQGAHSPSENGKGSEGGGASSTGCKRIVERLNLRASAKGNTSSVGKYTSFAGTETTERREKFPPLTLS